jgi:hypothetical protein
MEQILAQIVNAGLEGEAYNYVLQRLDTNSVFSFSQITTISESNTSYNITLNDNDLDQDPIKRILDGGHKVNINVDVDNNVTLYF